MKKNHPEHLMYYLECLKLAQSAQYDYHGQVMSGGSTAAVVARATAYAEFVFGVKPDTSEVA